MRYGFILLFASVYTGSDPHQSRILWELTWNSSTGSASLESYKRGRQLFLHKSLILIEKLSPPSLKSKWLKTTMANEESKAKMFAWTGKESMLLFQTLLDYKHLSWQAYSLPWQQFVFFSGFMD